MKKFIIFILSSLILLSCDKRKDFYYLENENSNFSISHELLNNHSYYSATISDNLIIDTVKIGNDYHFKLKFNKEENIVDFTYNGIPELKINSIDYSSNSIKLETNEWIDFSVIIVNEGVYNLSFVITDSYGKSKTLKLKLVVFINRLPIITDWIIYTVGDLSPLHKRILLTAKDPDEIYGGGISYYQYIINGDTTNYPDNQMNYIFPSSGYYSFGFRCKDNDGYWSNIIQINNYYISD